jgi:hypothetical protein
MTESNQPDRNPSGESASDPDHESSTVKAHHQKVHIWTGGPLIAPFLRGPGTDIDTSNRDETYLQATETFGVTVETTGIPFDLEPALSKAGQAISKDTDQDVTTICTYISAKTALPVYDGFVEEASSLFRSRTVRSPWAGLCLAMKAYASWYRLSLSPYEQRTVARTVNRQRALEQATESISKVPARAAKSVRRVVSRLLQLGRDEHSPTESPTED